MALTSRLRPLVIAFLGALVIAGTVACAPAETRGAIHLGEVEGTVDGVLERYVDRVIDHAEDRDGRLVVLIVDTPGGEIGAMKRIAGRIERARIPVVTWVGPPGAQAVSAGTFIVMAGHIAAMAPGTSIGAASPVLITGDDLPETHGRKVEEDTVAFARGVAELHDRNPDWAESAVRDAVAASPQEALELGVIDLMAPTLESLLDAIEGREVTLLGGAGSTISVTDAPFVENPMTGFERFLKVVANPVVVGILILLGFIGIAIEFFSPGLMLPGAAGVLALIVGFLGAGALLPAEAAIVLLILAVGLLTAEFFLPGGILGVIGSAALLMALGIWAGQAATAVSGQSAFLITLAALLIVTVGAAFWLRRFVSSTTATGTRLN
ncbi:MAG: ATP-dependent Clp protease proteolytic subunit [Chloroflexi bacterium]|nr:ATP-dependent Clp protease proteolytic subunit [Chloroflexota bacterium]MDA1240469.1 ATP-dependent Clp protease proteolytic subunit [Chloroflexota bacterium]